MLFFSVVCCIGVLRVLTYRVVLMLYVLGAVGVNVGELCSVGSIVCVSWECWEYCVCPGSVVRVRAGVVRDRRRARLSHAWLVTPCLGTSLFLPKSQLLLLPVAIYCQSEGDGAAGPPSPSSLTLMWSWDGLPAQCQEARGQALSDGLMDLYRLCTWGHTLCVCTYIEEMKNLSNLCFVQPRRELCIFNLLSDTTAMIIIKIADAYNASDTVLITLHRLSNLILVTILRSSYFYYPHFIKEEPEEQKR